MTETAPGPTGRLSGERAVELRVAARLENLAVLRTLVGAAGALADLDLDAVADLRLAVDEVCTQLIRSAAPGATLLVVVDPGEDVFVVRASAPCRTDEVLAPGSFSWHVLTSLVDEVAGFNDSADPAVPGGAVGITLTTRRVGTAR